MDARHNAEKPPAEETVAQTTRLDKDHPKWCSVLALIVVVLIAIILVWLSNTPANTQADSFLGDLPLFAVDRKAEGGDADAQYNLAAMYYNGQGVTQDYKQAVKWCTKAAGQGYANAQTKLGLKYREGQGVSRSEVQQRVPVPLIQLGSSHSSVIESKTNGVFEGWEGETIVILMNGQIWQQTEYYYHYHYAFMPDVLIYKSGSGWKMKIEGIERAVGVQQLEYSRSTLQAVRSAAIPKIYVGVGGGHWLKKNIDSGTYMVLEDGTLWAIDPFDKIDAVLWLPISNITVTESSSGSPGYDYLLINTDDDEKAHAQYMGKQ
ncbi:MAG: hypothetical protein DRP66_02725 [Planctomycetota bacterium]|nr:MAG: hypothetical protein DRP66_02725 [Planctomycetota bacterium]